MTAPPEVEPLDIEKVERESERVYDFKARALLRLLLAEVKRLREEGANLRAANSLLADEAKVALASDEENEQRALAAEKRAGEAEELVGAAREILSVRMTMRCLAENGTPDGYLERYAAARRLASGKGEG
jgi:hypothetical protein